ncbi:hypothetical protein MJL81_32845, partial [Salmonella enterica subsp. enterica serovar Anatum]|nr:hypothetical protein [Salmonella enterica subsp. enterica serovar Anatum]
AEVGAIIASPVERLTRNTDINFDMQQRRASWMIVALSTLLAAPALGVVAVKAVPPQNQGAALATYTVFMDMSLGVTGPLAGLVM